MNQPNLNDSIRVWPSPGQRVQDGAGAYGKFLAADGREVVWDHYWHRRLLDGSVCLHDPRPRATTQKE